MARKEEIEQAAMQVGGVHPDWDALECFRVGYKEGAKWADKTMIEKACQWLMKYFVLDHEGMSPSGYGVFEYMFRKAMEE